MSTRFIRKAAVLLLPLLACSCQWMQGDYVDEIADSYDAQYINITISVSASNSPLTRAPLGGEYGDGVETGISRENNVNDITLIFYKDDEDNNGINTTSDNVKVVCVKKYRVHPIASSDLPTGYEHSHGDEPTDPDIYDVPEKEVLYSTGRQKLSETTLQVGETYKVLVVANADVAVSVGDKIKDVRQKVLSTVYTGSGVGIDANDFVMASECDATIVLEDPEKEVVDGENRFIYYFNCIHMERLAARIDYCTKGATYDATYGGYKYKLGATDDDGFVVITKVVPFNLYNEDEFLFKRVQEWQGPNIISTTWLGKETTTNYVVDPNTVNKIPGAGGPGGAGANALSYLNPVAENIINSTGYTQVMSAVQGTDALITDALGENNVIIAYPRENTLRRESPLKKYATGIAFEAKRYNNPQSEPVTYVYYHFLRHQGEKQTGAYDAKLWRDLKDNIGGPDVPAMNIGIVRNNIYRVSIHSFNEMPGAIKIEVEEKHWRHVDNPLIYL